MFQLNIKNCRLQKISDVSKHMYGIRIMGYKATEELYTKNADTQAQLYKQLIPFCTQFHIGNEYCIKALIGRGTFSKVLHLLGTFGW